MSFEEFQNRARLYVIGALENGESQEFEQARAELGRSSIERSVDDRRVSAFVMDLSGPDDLLGAGHDLADDPGGELDLGAEVASDRLGVVLGDDQDQADPHVEDAEHLGVGDVSLLLEPGKDGRNLSGVAAELDREAVGEDPRRVVDQAAAGDVGDPVHGLLDAVVAVDGLHRPHVDPGRLQ